MKKLLVTGASGFLGSHICKLAHSRWDVFGTAFSHPGNIPGCKTIMIDLTKYDDVRRICAEIKPDALIHTAAVSQPNFCQNAIDQSFAINVTATVSLAGICSDSRIPFLFTSTDLVFSGKHAPYKETDPVSPINVYGEHKVLAEEGIRKSYPLACICRMPLMFGDPSPSSESFLQPILKALKNQTVSKLFNDEFRTPVSALSAAQGLLMFLEHGLPGTFHCGGRERFSRYDFGLKLADYCGLSAGVLGSIPQKSIVMAAPRPEDVSLNSSLAFSLGYCPLSLNEEFDRLNCLHQ